MGAFLKLILGFIPGVGPALSLLSSIPAKAWLWIAGVIAAGLLAWRAISFVEAAQADHAAVAVLTSQVAQATAAANANATALRMAEAQHAAVLSSATAATRAAAARAAVLSKNLEALHHAHSVCSVAPGSLALLDRLRR